jgi:hypothetical protein
MMEERRQGGDKASMSLTKGKNKARIAVSVNFGRKLNAMRDVAVRISVFGKRIPCAWHPGLQG